MRENLTSGSVRGLIATSELLLQQEVGYEFYLTKKAFAMTQKKVREEKMKIRIRFLAFEF